MKLNISKILMCLVELLDDFSSTLQKQSSRDLLSSMREDRNQIAHFITHDDGEVLKRFKLELIKREVTAMRAGSPQYDFITSLYGVDEIEDLFCSLLRFLGRSESRCVDMPTDLQRRRAEL